MTRQQSADRDLAIWQAHRVLMPCERMELLLFDFLQPPALGETEYDAMLRDVAEAVA